MFLRPHERVRLYDGLPDPPDPTRFTIDYDLNDVRGTIDGAIDGDSVVTLTPRAGRCIYYDGRGMWGPGDAPLPEWVDRMEMLGATTHPTSR